MADINYSIINLDGISEVAVLLIEKISDAIGWIASKNTPEKEAIQTFIEDIKDSNFDPITKSALISNANTIVKDYCNQASILQNALMSLRSDAKPGDVDNDWISQFMNKAKLVSDPEFQIIWGRILAEECNTPGYVPRSLLHVLEQMDRNDAEKFTAICALSVYTMEGNTKEYTPIIIDEHMGDYYSDKGVRLSDLIDLQALGLINVDISALSTGYTLKFDSSPVIIYYYDNTYVLPNGIKQFSVGNVIFTKIGQALCHAIEVDGHEDFFDKICSPFWEKDISS